MWRLVSVHWDFRSLRYFFEDIHIKLFLIGASFYRQLREFSAEDNRVFHLIVVLFGIFLVDYIGDNIVEKVKQFSPYLLDY